jgi:hypothetical protein
MIIGWTNRMDGKHYDRVDRRRQKYERHKEQKKDMIFPIISDGSCISSSNIKEEKVLSTMVIWHPGFV